MRQLMEYKIISGSVIEIHRSFMHVRRPEEARPGRAPKVAGNTSERKIKANKQSSIRSAAQVLNCNIGAGDVHVVLKYDDAHLLEDYEAAEADLKRAFSKFRYEFKKLFGNNPKIFWTTANWSPHRNAPARLHHHVVIKAEAFEILKTIWDRGSLSADWIDDRKDHTDLAAYIIANVHDRPSKQSWHCTRNMERPIITEPEPVDDVEAVKAPKDSVIKQHESYSDEEGHVTSSYLRCTLPAAPYIRGGKVVMPRPQRRKHKEAYHDT